MDTGFLSTLVVALILYAIGLLIAWFIWERRRATPDRLKTV